MPYGIGLDDPKERTRERVWTRRENARYCPGSFGRKNYLFTGSIDGGRRLATVYTLILSCRNLGIDAREYLIDVLDKLRNQWPLARLSELIPDNWAAARRVVA